MTGVWKYIPEDHSNNKFYFRYGNNDTMFYVLKGEAKFCTSDGKITTIRKSDQFFIPKGSEGTWKILIPFTTLFIQTDYPDNWSFPI
ncbi:cupin domain-containing protein [Bacillus sp. ISL-7]|uniref:cupin domain-containing protein n=1 Tax=Bacillus sp. ISL-7 TaxID=2819136 RepID=UPI001BE81832|nr:cupin domain-containing protein [Bacillus sp. ISL-7]